MMWNDVVWPELRRSLNGMLGVRSELERCTRSWIGVESEYQMCKMFLKCENRRVSVGRDCTNLSAFFVIWLVLWIWPWSSISMGVLFLRPLVAFFATVPFLMPTGLPMKLTERVYLAIVFISSIVWYLGLPLNNGLSRYHLRKPSTIL